MSTFRYQGNPNEVLNKKTLPKDQQKLADAAANSGSPSVVDSITSNAAFKGAEAGTDSAFATGATGAALNFAAKRAGSAALGAAGGTLSAYTPHAAALYGGYKAGQTLDKQFGLSDKIASGIGGLLGYDVNKGAITDEERLAINSGRNPAVEQKGNIVQGPITPSERGAIDAGLNPNKPINNSMDLSTITGKYGAGKEDNVIAYEPLMQKSGGELATAATENYASQFEGAYQNKDGSYTGLTTAGGKQSMTPEQYASYAEQQKLGLSNPNAVPMGDYTSVAGTSGSVQQPLGYNAPAAQTQQSPRDLAVAQGQARLEGFRGGEGLSDAARIATGQMEAPEGYNQRIPATGPYIPQAPTQAPQAPQMTVGEEAQANFERFKASGKEMTLDQFTQATELAESAGRTFNEETGYSKDFDPVAQEAYKQEVAGRSPQPVTPSATPSIDSRASEARSNYERESAAREARMDEKSSARTQMRVGGEMVPATEENRKRRDLEKSFKAQAKRDGLTPAETRTYVADSMRERSQETEDRAVQKEMDDLNISSSQARLAVTLKSLQPEAAKKMTENEFSGFIGMMEKLGVSLDPESGALLQVEDGVFIDGTKPLSPNSELFQKVMELEGGAEFLAAPSAVKGDLAGQPVGTKSMSEDGTNRVWEVIDADGTLKQVR